MLLLLGFAATGGAQGVPMDKPSLFDSLNQKAAQAHDEPSTRALFVEIQGSTLGGPLPKSMLERLVHAQRDFQGGKRAPVTEEALAEAINKLGRKLNPEIYSGTNATQIISCANTACVIPRLFWHLQMVHSRTVQQIIACRRPVPCTSGFCCFARS
jgi:hypothetical protein